MGLISTIVLGAAALGLMAVVLYQRRQIARLGARLVEATRVDTLTGLLNRRAFEEMLDEELERSLRTGRPLSVIVGDLDWLQLVNARHGSETGDVVLQLVAQDLRKWKRRIDSAARIGGEEFGLILPGSGREAGIDAAERLREAVAAESCVTLSLGVVEGPRDGASADDLLRAADRALYAAKAGGRDRTAAPERATAAV